VRYPRYPVVLTWFCARMPLFFPSVPSMPSIAAAPQSNFKGFLLSLTAAVMWGMLPVALKEVLTGMDATTIVWYRFLIAGVVLWGWLAATKQLPMLASAPVITKWFLLFASASLCANYFFFSYSLNFVNGETSEAVGFSLGPRIPWSFLDVQQYLYCNFPLQLENAI